MKHDKKSFDNSIPRGPNESLHYHKQIPLSGDADAAKCALLCDGYCRFTAAKKKNPRTIMNAH